ncbi:MAG TPA: PIG-L deacetylase family protein [Actinomycetota bacterium]|nr:PIG-L deacetylase family protein [Actinomycetota bacterium]
MVDAELPPSEPRTGPVLAVFAHPDDAEISVGGTIAKWCAAGREVHLLVLTNGDRGSSDPAQDREDLARIRYAETVAAGQVLGLASVRILSIHDGELENTDDVREAVTRRVREVRAETLLSCDPTLIFFRDSYYNHSDHRTAGFIALDSVFPGSGNPHFHSEHLGEGLEIQEVTDVWLGWTDEPNHVEDISEHFRAKVDALAEHASQLAEGIRFFEKFLAEDAVKAGEKIGVTHAEEFRVLDLR